MDMIPIEGWDCRSRIERFDINFLQSEGCVQGRGIRIRLYPERGVQRPKVAFNIIYTTKHSASAGANARAINPRLSVGSAGSASGDHRKRTICALCFRQIEATLENEKIAQGPHIPPRRHAVIAEAVREEGPELRREIGAGAGHLGLHRAEVDEPVAEQRPRLGLQRLVHPPVKPDLVVESRQNTGNFNLLSLIGNVEFADINSCARGRWNGRSIVDFAKPMVFDGIIQPAHIKIGFRHHVVSSVYDVERRRAEVNAAVRALSSKDHTLGRIQRLIGPTYGAVCAINWNGSICRLVATNGFSILQRNFFTPGRAAPIRHWHRSPPAFSE